MKFNLIYLTVLILAASLLVGCKEDPETVNADLDLNITGLEDLGSDFAYEGWLIVNGDPVTTGTFSVDASGNLSKSSFTVSESDLSAATTFVLTIEPSPDSDPSPSKVHILAGDFNGENAALTISHGAALNHSFGDAAGNYILATPTNGSDNDENSGLWFLTLDAAGPSVGLDLPTLPEGWLYEGWAVIDGVPVSTGTFSDVQAVDNAAPFSGSEGGPPFPGEDFIVNAPAGLSFPVDLSGGKAVISIEPVPDNSDHPFLLKPLVGDIPAGALDHQTYGMNQNLNFPTGTVVR